MASFQPSCSAGVSAETVEEAARKTAMTFRREVFMATASVGRGRSDDNLNIPRVAAKPCFPPAHRSPRVRADVPDSPPFAGNASRHARSAPLWGDEEAADQDRG